MNPFNGSPIDLGAYVSGALATERPHTPTRGELEDVFRPAPTTYAQAVARGFLGARVMEPHVGYDRSGVRRDARVMLAGLARLLLRAVPHA